jgi:methyl-accepting chemotaxis protein
MKDAQGAGDTLAKYREIVDFLDIDSDVKQRLPEVWKILSPKLPGVLERFYQKLAQKSDLQGLIGAAGNIDRLKKAQYDHWELLFSGDVGQEYFDRVYRIGVAHQRIGLEPKWYMSGYNFVLAEISDILSAQGMRKMRRSFADMTVVSRVIFLDMCLAISVYSDLEMKARAARSERIDELVRQFEGVSREAIALVLQKAKQIESEANRMAKSADDSSKGSLDVASAAARANQNITAVAAAAEELAQSAAEIGQQTSMSQSVADEAQHEAQRSNERVQSLAEAAEKIGDVVNLINDIAGQTNLLALNATIEAARAGEAGKGFAVVASEVKNLANQTARATEEISRQISSVQDATNDAVGAIGGIVKTISRMSEIGTAIASAIEQQQAATQEIASNATTVTEDAKTVTESVGDLTKTSASSFATAIKVLWSASDLREPVSGLEGEVGQFISGVRSA